MEAWLHGHATHPELDGRNDVVLKQGAEPGEKLPVSACPRTSTVASGSSATASVTHPRVDPSSGRPDRLPSHGPRDPSRPRPVQPVKAKPLRNANHPSASVRVAASGTRGELPFTGLPLWAVALAGCWLIGSGLALRKAFYDAGPAADPALAQLRIASRTGSGSRRS
jgi:hypothetical protein